MVDGHERVAAGDVSLRSEKSPYLTQVFPYRFVGTSRRSSSNQYHSHSSHAGPRHATSKIASTSTGMFAGSDAMPTAARPPMPLSSPKISTINSLNPFTT